MDFVKHIESKAYKKLLIFSTVIISTMLILIPADFLMTVDMFLVSIITRIFIISTCLTWLLVSMKDKKRSIESFSVMNSICLSTVAFITIITKNEFPSGLAFVFWLSISIFFSSNTFRKNIIYASMPLITYVIPNIMLNVYDKNFQSITIMSLVGISITLFLNKHMNDLLSKDFYSKIALEDKIIQLENALTNIKRLEGMIPMCAWCKKIRDDDGYWNNVEKYIEDKTNVSGISHGICPECKTSMLEDVRKS